MMQSTDASQVMLGEQARVQPEAVLVSALFHCLAVDHNALNLAGASDQEVQALLVTMQSVRDDSLRRRALRKMWEARGEAWRARCEAWRAQREAWQAEREAWRVRREVWRETRRVRRAEARARLLARPLHTTLSEPPAARSRGPVVFLSFAHGDMPKLSKLHLELTRHHLVLWSSRRTVSPEP